jgi:putative transposase
MRTAYKCRAYPDPDQQALLARTFGCVRVVWNRTLAARQTRWSTERKGTTYRETDTALTAMKRAPELAFLNEVSSVPLQQTLRHQHQAFRAFLAGRARYPRYKSRRGRQTAHYTRSAFRWGDGQLWLAKMRAPLSLIWSWPEVDPATLALSSVTLSRDPDGRWYATLQVVLADPVRLPPTGRAVGIDLGLTDLLVTSHGERIPNPRHLARKAANLARYQRRMARKRKGSANRAKAATKVARAHRKVRAARADFLHRTSTRLVREHDLIVLEDLNIRGMVRNRHLARAISDSGWGTFRAMLAYKAARAGRRLVVLDRWYPSSKMCSACGYLLVNLALGTRMWVCPGCGARHDRDLNAARNILAAGRAVAACGADVSHPGSSRVQSAVKQEPQLVRAGIPSFRAGSSQS